MPQPNSSNEFSTQFLSFIRQQAKQLRGEDPTPKNLTEWKATRSSIRRQLMKSMGGFPKEHCALEPRILGSFKRDGYRVEKIVFQTFPGVHMTANAYVPDGQGKRPAVLCVHGHWKGAKQDPVVQSRCIGLAKLGFFVLGVDALGAGERGLGKKLGEYHGEMVASTLWSSGLSLSGLQVYENMRAADYLQSRPEVDPDQLAVTGTSGGGNQTMYAGALEERFKAVIPVCSVGNYQAYLGVACCMCEVVPSALKYTEEWGVLGLVAPRALMVINATRDGIQFSVAEAKKSLAKARDVFAVYNKPGNVRHTVVESTHDYNRPMREAMYGWVTRHLKGEGDGSPIAEPDITPEDREFVRCYPGDSRPDTFVTLPKFAMAKTQEQLVKTSKAPVHREHWESLKMTMDMLLPRALGGFPRRGPIQAKLSPAKADVQEIQFAPEPGITVTAKSKATRGNKRLAIVLDLDKASGALESPIAKALVDESWNVVAADLRATGSTAHKSDSIRRAPDHNTAQWSMWIGRPLLGQWVYDVSRLLDVIDEHAGGLPESVAVIGTGPASMVALAAAAVDDRLTQAATVGGLATYVSGNPYEKQRVGILVPGILRDVGDVAQIASMAAPNRLIVANGVDSQNKPLSLKQMQQRYSFTKAIYELDKQPKRFTIAHDWDAQAIAKAL